MEGLVRHFQQLEEAIAGVGGVVFSNEAQIERTLDISTLKCGRSNLQKVQVPKPKTKSSTSITLGIVLARNDKQYSAWPTPKKDQSYPSPSQNQHPTPSTLASSSQTTQIPSFSKAT
jgi:hypothetical protein